MAQAAVTAADLFPATRKKPIFPIGDGLRAYLKHYKRDRDLPLTYERLRAFRESIPLVDDDGKPTLWDSVIYDPEEMRSLNEALKEVYAFIKVGGDLSVVRHLYADRIDFCTFGNSMPFRIRIVNAYNDNQDYFYVKRADASRVYGLELEHLLSPNRLNFITNGNTLIEEHIAGIPGDNFIAHWLTRPEIRPVRVAKELVKFNDRCFVRLLGDMRSYNFVFVVTPDFEGFQLRIRAMDFDQQSYSGRKNFYRPQFFSENREFALFCQRHMRRETAEQYVREDRTLLIQRADLAARRLEHLVSEMERDPISPAEKIVELRESLAEHYGRSDYLKCTSMGALVRENIESVRRSLAGSGVRTAEFSMKFPRLIAFLAALGPVVLSTGCINQGEVDHRHPKISHDVTLASDHPTAAYAIESGAQLRITLPVPSAGYNWSIVGNNTRVLEQTTHLAPKAGSPAPAVAFYALKPGRSLIRFVLLRAGEEDAIPKQHFDVGVLVKEPDE